MTVTVNFEIVLCLLFIYFLRVSLLSNLFKCIAL